MFDNRNGYSNGNGNGHKPGWWSALWNRPDPAEESMAAYRRLALQLHHDLSRANSPRSALLVTPATSNLCARGTVAVSSCFAEQVRRPVLLIDVCPKHPEATRLLLSDGKPGYAEFLEDPTISLEDLILPTNCNNVSFLPAGSDALRTNPTSSDNIRALLEAAEARYDYVLLSGGSVLHDPTIFALAPYVGCVLLLVIENQTMMEDLEAAREVLEFCKVRKVGLLFTTPVAQERRSV